MTEEKFIELTNDIQFRDYPGRYTNLIKGARGYILTKDEIRNLPNATENEKKNMLIEWEYSRNKGSFYVLVAGYPVTLSEKDFFFLNEQPHFLCGQLI